MIFAPGWARRSARACACSTSAAASAEPRFTSQRNMAPRSPASTWPKRWSPSPTSAPQSSGWKTRCKFVLGDVLEEKFAEPFDIIWSRDAFMHIPDKARLFSRLYDLSAPGGRLVITDYARGKTPGLAGI